jgi:hypothetical protein
MANEPVPPPIVELIPSTQDRISAVGSSNAPFIFFDRISNFGTYNGIAHMTLLATRFLPNVDGNPAHDFVVTAHLRMNLPALAALKAAIEGIEAMLKAPEGTSIN